MRGKSHAERKSVYPHRHTLKKVSSLARVCVYGVVGVVYKHERKGQREKKGES